MRLHGTMHPTDLVPVPADTVNTILIGGTSAQAMDWPTTGTPTNAGAQGVGMVRFTGLTTGNASFNFQVNLFSTAAATPSSGSSISSSGVNHTVLGQGTYQIPGGSTGFSVAALTSGYIQVECWKK